MAHKKRALNQPLSSTPKRSQFSNLSPNRAHSNSFYYSLSFDYLNETVVDRDFIPELHFTHFVYHELGFNAYLESRNLSTWSNTLFSYCLRLVREFYTNLSSSVPNESSLGF